MPELGTLGSVRRVLGNGHSCRDPGPGAPFGKSAYRLEYAFNGKSIGGCVKHIVKSSSEGLTIEISETSGQQEQLLAEFQACQEGRCSCPTSEYEKLDSLRIEAVSGKVRLSLRAKSGQVLDGSEIQKCLNHTEKKLDPSS